MKLSARMQKKQWNILPAKDISANLAKSLDISPLLAQVLVNREITDAQTAGIFLRPKLTELIPPEELPGVKAAVQRIKQAVNNGEKISVYGDYDVDGITAVAILWQILTLLGANVDYYVPHRVDEGYGLNTDAVELLAKNSTSLLITVDCGITACDSVKLAADLGLDVIITDHHQPGSELPQAPVIVHPALDRDYPNQDSCGALVAFKLAWAVANEFSPGKKLEPKLRDFMLNATSLAAMGTVADIMDLRGENRILTSFGLKTLEQCQLPGIQALIESAGLTGKGLDSFHIGFKLAPMLNAAGRMGHARLAVELLTSDSDINAVQIAEYLKDQNNQRRQCEKKIFKQACEMITSQNLSHPDNKSIVLASQHWHTGVIGIVASRIVDKYFRPTIMINTSNGTSQGSARSIPGFDILEGISACSKHLTTFGGHKMAAGIKLKTENIEKLTTDFEVYARENLTQSDITAKLDIDAVAPLSEFTKDFITNLQLLAPFGKGNPEPVFATKGVRLAAPPRRVGAKGDHLQLALSDSTASIRCVAFGMGALEKKLLENEFFDVAYQAQINTYNGSSSVQLVIADIRFE